MSEEIELARFMAALITSIGLSFVLGYFIGHQRGQMAKVGPLVEALFSRKTEVHEEDDHEQSGRKGPDH